MENLSRLTRLEPVKAKANILICEDELIVALEMEEALRANNYRVTAIVRSAEEALSRLLDEEIRPDLVLLDVVLSGTLRGTEIAEAIQSKLNIPVVYLTGFSDKRTMRDIFDTHPYGYLCKPLNIRKLCVAVDIALAKFRAHKLLASR